MPGQRAEKDSRRAQILRAGHGVALRVGLDRLTVRLVAAKAGLSTGLVLFYFKTRERLVAALLGPLLKGTLVRGFTQTLARARSPLARLRTLLRSEMIRLSKEPRAIRLIFEYWVRGFRHPEIRARMRAERRLYGEAFGPAVEAVLAAEPERLRKVSAEGLTAAAVGMVEGYTLQSVTGPEQPDVDEYLTAAKVLLEEPGKSAA